MSSTSSSYATSPASSSASVPSPAAAAAVGGPAAQSPFADLTAHIFPPPEFVIVGAGVGGLTTAALFERARIPYVILEKRRDGAHLDGSDLGLFPAAISILSELGFDDAFWPEHSSAVRNVHLCKAHDLAGATAAEQRAAAAAAAASSCADPHRRGSSSSTSPPPPSSASLASPPPTPPQLRAAEFVPPLLASKPTPVVSPMKTLNMDKILGPGEVMRMTNRRSIMTALQRLVPRSKILFDSSVIQCTENDNHIEVMFTHKHVFSSLTVPVVIGADGVRSVCRRLIAATLGGDAELDAASSRYAGEICYRGSFSLTSAEHDPARAALLRQIEDLLIRDDFHKPHSMSLYYDRARRFSLGFLNETGSLAYWWVREKWAGSREAFRALQHKQPDMPHWPALLRALYALTQPRDFYLQPIVDREHDDHPAAWHSHRCVLLGDAAHPTTPALFQGANLAIEDAHLLVHLITSHPPTVPPAALFRQFAAARIKHVSRIQRESFRQTKVSQWDSKPSVLLRDAALKLIPTRLLESKLRKASAWDPRAALRSAALPRNSNGNVVVKPPSPPPPAPASLQRGAKPSKAKLKKSSHGTIKSLGAPSSSSTTATNSRASTTSSTEGDDVTMGSPMTSIGSSESMSFSAFLEELEGTMGGGSGSGGGGASKSTPTASPRPSMDVDMMYGPPAPAAPPSARYPLAPPSPKPQLQVPPRHASYDVTPRCMGGAGGGGLTHARSRSDLAPEMGHLHHPSTGLQHAARVAPPPPHHAHSNLCGEHRRTHSSLSAPTESSSGRASPVSAAGNAREPPSCILGPGHLMTPSLLSGSSYLSSSSSESSASLASTTGTEATLHYGMPVFAAAGEDDHTVFEFLPPSPPVAGAAAAPPYGLTRRNTVVSPPGMARPAA
ncbi:hypothetical protein H9P43_005699 [Blastocladiella emersonii ATCC 22665]|nr:hypothetical protein H9P43_005699 [Blastocladiella emersonii ATCC 22665]